MSPWIVAVIIWFCAGITTGMAIAMLSFLVWMVVVDTREQRDIEKAIASTGIRRVG